VVFEVVGVNMQPLVEWTGRGYVRKPGEALLCPFTPLRVRTVSMSPDGSTVVTLVGLVWEGEILRSPGVKRSREPFRFAETESLFQEGLALLELEDERGTAALARAANQGDIRAMIELAWDTKVSGDLAATYSWLRKAAEGGHVSAMNDVGSCLRTGVGVGVDIVEGLSWCRKAAESGHHGAMVRIGMAYAWGETVGVSRRTALDWFLEGATRGNIKAMLYIGQVLLDGGEVGVDKEAAVGEVG
jgi:TPR repeat protein